MLFRSLSALDVESKNIIKAQATSVFITTAVSQNGSLDSIFVFVSAMKLVWRLSIHYNQRPAISDLVKLYSNVFGIPNTFEYSLTKSLIAGL